MEFGYIWVEFSPGVDCVTSLSTGNVWERFVEGLDVIRVYVLEKGHYPELEKQIMKVVTTGTEA